MGAGQRNKWKRLFKTELHRLALSLGFNQAVWRVCFNKETKNNQKNPQLPPVKTHECQYTSNFFLHRRFQYLGTIVSAYFQVQCCSTIPALCAVLSQPCSPLPGFAKVGLNHWAWGISTHILISSSATCRRWESERCSQTCVPRWLLWKSVWTEPGPKLLTASAKSGSKRPYASENGLFSRCGSPIPF